MTGEDVLGLRRRLGMSQQEFGNLLGVSYATVQSWEVGRRRIHPLTARGITAAVAEYEAAAKKAGAAATKTAA